MGNWRALDDYSPFARTLVDYMWNQRPPLLPNQFADRMGVRKQALSTWLNGTVPAPPVVVRLARAMGLPVRQLLAAAGYATAEDPLLDLADAWAYVRAQVQQALEQSVSGADAATDSEGRARAALTPDDLHALFDQLQERACTGLPTSGSTRG
jgi:transcriptional regulator with XRE-family HTH domain